MMRGYGFGGGFGGGGMLLGGLLWILFVVAVVMLIVMLVRRAGMMHGHGPMMHDMHDMHGHGSMGASTPAVDEAVAIARKRFASGEITKEQFDELMGKLGS